MSKNPRLYFCCLSEPACLNRQTQVRIRIKRFDSFISFARVFLSYWKCGQLILSVYCHTYMSSAYNSTPKKRKGLLCCSLALLRKSRAKCWISEFVKLMLSLLRNRRARLGSYFSRTESSESVTNIQLLFLWDGRVLSDTLNVFVSWQFVSWKFWQSFTSPQHICLSSLQPSNPKWIMLFNHTVFKSASAV